MGSCDTPKESINNLLLVKGMYFPDEPIDWDDLLNEFAKPSQVLVLYNFYRKNGNILSCVECQSMWNF